MVLTKPSMRERATAGDENSAQAEKPGLHSRAKSKNRDRKSGSYEQSGASGVYEKVKREGLE